jgi:phospholipase C
MLENRSFDHLFGFFPGVNGLKGTETNLLHPGQPESLDNKAFRVGMGAPWAIARGRGPAHSIQEVNLQLFDGRSRAAGPPVTKNDGFVESYVRALARDGIANPADADIAVVMQSFGPHRLPAINALASQFVLCDNWYCEVPGPTLPNRLYMHAATSEGWGYNSWHATFEARTIYENLEEAGYTWAVYSFDANEVARYRRLRGRGDRFRHYDDAFRRDATSGALPTYTFLIPAFGLQGRLPNSSMHPPDDVRAADRLVAETYAALRANEEAWSKTLFIVTFDEHGGFYDHMAPPAEGIPNPDGKRSPRPGAGPGAPVFAFDRLGLRVPTILASPWLSEGHIEHGLLQHTSILATVKKLFGLPRFLTKRDAAAATFEGLFLASPRTRTPAAVPSLPLR